MAAMRWDAHWDKKIDSYVLGLLPEKERKAFEAEMAANPALREEVLLRRDIIIGLKAAERKALINKLKKHFQEEQNIQQTKPWYKKIVLIAVVLLLLIALLLYLVF